MKKTDHKTHSQLLCWTDRLSLWDKIIGHFRLLRERIKYFGYPVLSGGDLGKHYRLGKMDKLHHFQDKHLGERCYIIGNGPSLLKQDLSLLKDKITFGCNGIYLIKDKLGFLPTYYVIEDQLPAEDRAKEINDLEEPTKFIPLRLAYCLTPSAKTYYYNTAIRRYWWDPDFSKNASLGLFDGGTVLFHALQLAFYMGFSEVCLMGVDLNYDIPNDIKRNGVILTSTDDDPNHIHPDYFGKGYRWHDPLVHAMLAGFVSANRAYLEEGRKIYNVGVGGKLEVYPRVPLEEMVKRPVTHYNASDSREYLRLQVLNDIQNVPGRVASCLRDHVHADTHVISSDGISSKEIDNLIRVRLNNIFKSFCQEERNVAIYGAGKHTRRLLRLLRTIPEFDTMKVTVIDDSPDGESFAGFPLFKSSEFTIQCPIILSSDFYERALENNAAKLFGDKNVIYPIYRKAKNQATRTWPDASVNECERIKFLYEELILSLLYDWLETSNADSCAYLLVAPQLEDVINSHIQHTKVCFTNDAQKADIVLKIGTQALPDDVEHLPIVDILSFNERNS